jgi:tetratricopeptide (TPR) repeat protein
MRKRVGMIRSVGSALTLTAIVACRSATSGPYSVPSEVSRSTVEAEKLSREGADLAETDPVKAEKILCEALSKDLFFGPAHNNLGVLYLKQQKLYEAANEFEWAKKLMPGHPDPRVNLAITLEMAGKVEDALAAYKTALEVYPEYLPAIEGLARLSTRLGKNEDKLQDWLGTIAMRAEEVAWKEWARARLAKER